jgi:hypothetical protein
VLEGGNEFLNCIYIEGRLSCAIPGRDALLAVAPFVLMLQKPKIA